VPLELVGGVDLGEVLARALCLALVFVSNSLAVRATFEQTPVRRRRFEQRSMLLPIAGSVALYQTAPRQALAVLLAGLLAVVLWRVHPSTKHLKPVGLALAGLAALVVVVLNLST
jgi:hypothetical protein